LITNDGDMPMYLEHFRNQQSIYKGRLPSCSDSSSSNSVCSAIAFLLSSAWLLTVLYQLEPASDSLGIFAQGSYIVIPSIKLDFELKLALDKVGSPLLANWVLVMLSKESVISFTAASRGGLPCTLRSRTY
jgi:hypothetical protein